MDVISKCRSHKSWQIPSELKHICSARQVSIQIMDDSYNSVVKVLLPLSTAVHCQNLGGGSSQHAFTYLNFDWCDISATAMKIIYISRSRFVLCRDTSSHSDCIQRRHLPHCFCLPQQLHTASTIVLRRSCTP